ncbi:MAG: hypothetical protein FWF10_01635 [Clostridiales bacterium]|nr:hypothetical protein [Clostridiales bacterium]
MKQQEQGTRKGEHKQALFCQSGKELCVASGLSGFGNRYAQKTEFFQVIAYFCFCVVLIVIRFAKILKGGTVFQHVIDGNEHGMRDGDFGAVLPARNDKALILCLEEGAVRA